MIEPDGKLKILDFGLARVLEPVLPPLTGRGRGGHRDGGNGITGTLCYMSPEQIRGEAVDHRTDLFSFGVVLFEPGHGILPFSGNTAADLISSILRDEPRSAVKANPRLPASTTGFRGLFEKDARSRIASARSFPGGPGSARREGRHGRQGEETSSIAVLPLLDMSPEKDQALLLRGNRRGDHHRPRPG